MDRWATFDCYGTLIDWNGGIGRELERLFGPDRAGSMLHRYHEIEPQVQREDPKRSYREVMAISLARLGPVAAGEEDALGRSLPSWQPFGETHASLEDARKRGWKLAILSNTDRDFIDASMERIGVPFELAIVASEIGSYKPAHRHWEEFFSRTGADRNGHVHVGASLFHDVAPARELGLRTIWVNRLGEEPNPRPDVELRTLTGLGGALDELAP
ncbi:MAG TPA: HAD-IA family hydrolase [Gaiellaceae bacterium]|jgi:2-haloacid dehalogenase|nr:HAD-IA family hydrolase [Gaiellaceae bacterium]HZQ89819.1 HAD-IA family hydrolase [Gaiellaceae bacterium]